MQNTDMFLNKDEMVDGALEQKKQKMSFELGFSKGV